MNIHETFNAKFRQLEKRLRVETRCNQRTPGRLAWLVLWMRDRPAPSAPKGCWRPSAIFFPTDELKSAPLDRLARTFVAMEEVEAWLDRCEAGLARHQAEVERQTAGAIARLKTAAAMA